MITQEDIYHFSDHRPEIKEDPESATHPFMITNDEGCPIVSLWNKSIDQFYNGKIN